MQHGGWSVARHRRVYILENDAHWLLPRGLIYTGHVLLFIRSRNWNKNWFTSRSHVYLTVTCVPHGHMCTSQSHVYLTVTCVPHSHMHVYLTVTRTVPHSHMCTSQSHVYLTVTCAPHSHMCTSQSHVYLTVTVLYLTCVPHSHMCTSQSHVYLICAPLTSHVYLFRVRLPYSSFAYVFAYLNPCSLNPCSPHSHSCTSQSRLNRVYL